MVTGNTLPPLPHSWSELSWQQLCDCWRAKIRYGGKADVARVAALLSLCGCSVCRRAACSEETGENVYILRGRDGSLLSVTPREAAQLAMQAIPWFDYPYGDPGEKEVTDEKGRVVKPRREGVAGYVGPMRDALALQRERLEVDGVTFALPQVACNNLTWQQYRTLQTLAPQLFAAGITEEQTVGLQAQFLAHCLVPARDRTPDTDRFAPAYIFRYDVERAEQTVAFWTKRLKVVDARKNMQYLFHVCFQCYQTALTYYASAYPLLFSEGEKSDPHADALKGESGTINAIMMKANYVNQQEVYDSNLPFILDILNTMAKEAKEIEKMNAKIKRK